MNYKTYVPMGNLPIDLNCLLKTYNVLITHNASEHSLSNRTLFLDNNDNLIKNRQKIAEFIASIKNNSRVAKEDVANILVPFDFIKRIVEDRYISDPSILSKIFLVNEDLIKYQLNKLQKAP